MYYFIHTSQRLASFLNLARIPAFLLFLLILGSLGPFLHAQDRIYLFDNTELEGRVLQVDKKIFYSHPKNGKDKTYKVPKKKVGIIRYQNGLVHAFGGGRERQLAFNTGGVDRIFLVSGQILPVELGGIFSDHIEYISLADPSREQISTPKSGVLALIQQGRDLVRYVSVSKLVANFLRSEEIPVAEEQISESQPDVSVPAVSTTETEPARTSAGTQSSGASSTAETSLMNIDEEEFKQKALDKTRRLSQYIGLIANKSTPIMEANQAVSQAITLFISDSSFVQVSNVKSPTKVRDFYIRQYLENVKLLKYDRVEIEWVDINYVGEVRKGPDGNYYGTITFVQKFRGIRDNRVVYEDKTMKKAEVVLKTYGKNFMGTTEELWDVFLSNIKVEHTTSY